MPDDSPQYYMTISLNVLNHMGLNLYSNTPAVLAEVIANSWDADATSVDVDFDIKNKVITIKDDGCGMTHDDINRKYLYVGYQKRPPGKDEFLTPEHKRAPMGRKGIGKLSLFSIANQIEVYTRVKDGEPEAFRMDAEKIRKAIDKEDPSRIGQYKPESIPVNEQAPASHGTTIRITDLKKLRLTRAAVDGLRCRIARRFSIIGATNKFNVKINGDPITITDRNYFHKARFIFQYGDNFAKLCDRLQRDENDKIVGAINRDHKISMNGDSSGGESCSIQGWIAIAHRSNDLDGEDDNENLNKITIVVRGKVAQEDILQDFRLGGMITKYMFGEIKADFLDVDSQPDIATSSRQRISEDDERYKTLAKFIQAELKEIWRQTNTLKENAGLRCALSSNPHVKEWYEALRPPELKKFAGKIFGDIDKAGIDEAGRQEAYANGVMLFEHLKMNHATNRLERIDVTKVDEFLRYIRDVDALETEHYRQIVRERLAVIGKLREAVDEDAKERILQEYIYDHLFLLDPGWERATMFGDMEKRMEKAFESSRKRVDIRYVKYRRVAAAHVIVELKKRSARIEKTALEKQIGGYMRILKDELTQGSRKNAVLPIEGICVVGHLPNIWKDPKERWEDEAGLMMKGIRIVTYDELIDNAYFAYGKFLEASKSQNNLRDLVDKVRAHNPAAPVLPGPETIEPE